MIASKTNRSPAAKTGDGKDCTLDYFLDLAGANAAGADMHPHVGTVLTYRFDALKVGFRHLLRFVVGMAHFVAAQFAFAANFTGTCHWYDPPYLYGYKKQAYITIRPRTLQG